MLNSQTDTHPPGIIDSLNAGFGTVAQKPGLLLIPLVVDLFLWLGPRLSVARLVPELSIWFRQVLGETTDSSSEIFYNSLTEILESYNLFSALSTWPLGTPSLLAGNDVGAGPLGQPLSLSVQGFDEFVAWLLSLSLAGLLIGSLYFTRIAYQLGKRPDGIKSRVKLALLNWASIVAFVFVVLIGAFLLSVPFFLFLEILSMIAPPLASLAMLLGIGIAAWSLFHLVFAIHGILLDDLGVTQAMSRSINLVRRYRLSAVGLLLLALIISLGLNNIWHIPPSDSWMRLTAIAGNAFINTGLAAATFVFYHERAALLEDSSR